MTLQNHSSLPVFCHTFFSVVLPTIQFNNQTNGRAIKINNEIINRPLPVKSASECPQEFIPKFLFCLGHIFSECFGPFNEFRIVWQMMPVKNETLPLQHHWICIASGFIHLRLSFVTPLRKGGDRTECFRGDHTNRMAQ